MAHYLNMHFSYHYRDMNSDFILKLVFELFSDCFTPYMMDLLSQANSKTNWFLLSDQVFPLLELSSLLPLHFAILDFCSSLK